MNSHNKMDKSEYRMIFLYEYKLGTKAAETARNINKAFGEESVPVRTVQRWFQRFQQGDEGLNDGKHTGRKRSLDDDTLVEVVEAAEPGTSVRKLAQDVGKTKSTISRHLRELAKKEKMDECDPLELTEDKKKLKKNKISVTISSK